MSQAPPPARRLQVFGKFKLEHVFSGLDMFTQPVPQFSIRGRAEVSSQVGRAVSLVIYIVILLYSTHKLMQLLSRANPTVSSSVEFKQLDSSAVFDLYAENYRFAFGVEGFLDKQFKDDPRFVKPFFRKVWRTGGVEFEKILQFHKCTDDDYEQFAPPGPGE